MRRRPLGGSELEVPSLIIGTMARRGDDPDTRLAIYRDALARGLTCFDTAPLYGFGAADELLGQAIRSVPRDAVTILSKCGLRWDDDARGDTLFRFTDTDGHRRTVRRDSRPLSVRRDVEASLRRLGTDYLDLIQIHQPDPQTPIAETMGELLDLRRQGKVRQIGVSNFSMTQIEGARRALGDVPLVSDQLEFNLVQRPEAVDIVTGCGALGIGTLAYSPLAGGRLTEALPEVVGAIADRHAIPAGVVPLAWVLGHSGITAAITGVSSLKQLAEQALAAAVTLSDEERAVLADAFRGAVLADPQRPSRGLRLRQQTRRLLGAGLRACGISPSRLRRLLGRERW